MIEGQRPTDGAGPYVVAGRLTDDGALLGVGVEKLPSDLTSGDEAIKAWASIGMSGNGTLLAQP